MPAHSRPGCNMRSATAIVCSHFYSPSLDLVWLPQIGTGSGRERRRHGAGTGRTPRSVPAPSEPTGPTPPQHRSHAHQPPSRRRQPRRGLLWTPLPSPGTPCDAPWAQARAHPHSPPPPRPHLPGRPTRTPVTGSRLRWRSALRRHPPPGPAPRDPWLPQWAPQTPPRDRRRHPAPAPAPPRCPPARAQSTAALRGHAARARWAPSRRIWHALTSTQGHSHSPSHSHMQAAPRLPPSQRVRPSPPLRAGMVTTNVAQLPRRCRGVSTSPTCARPCPRPLPQRRMARLAPAPRPPLPITRFSIPLMP